MLRTGVVVVVLLYAGCEAAEDAKQAAAAAKALMVAADKAKEMGEAADKAADEAEAKAKAEIPEGASEQQAAQFVENAKAVAALQAMGKAGGTGPIVNWRQLQPFLPDSLGDYAADGDFDGSTNKVAGMKVTTAKRRYKAGERQVDVTITDTSMVPMLRAPFQMAAMVEEDSSSGYKKGTKLEGHSAILEWRKSSKRSHATVLCADRFVVDVKVRGTDKDDEAASVAKLLGLGKLAEVKAEQEPAGE